MTSAPDLEQQKISSVDWNKVSSGNFFNDDELEPKDLESTEAIQYLRKILEILSMQVGGMAIAGFACKFSIFKALVGNSLVLYLSLFLTVAFFVMMHVKEDLRKDSPMNHTYLLAGSICMMVCFGALAGMTKSAAVVTFMMAAAFAVLSLYLGARLATSSTKREYLIRKLLVGALAGFLATITVMIYAMSSFKSDVKTPTVILTVVFYLLLVMYFGYTLVFVILPGHEEYKDDYIWSVLRMYIHLGMVVVMLGAILLAWLKSCCMNGHGAIEPN